MENIIAWYPSSIDKQTKFYGFIRAHGIENFTVRLHLDCDDLTREQRLTAEHEEITRRGTYHHPLLLNGNNGNQLKLKYCVSIILFLKYQQSLL